MDLEGTMLSEISKTEEDKVWPHLYVEFKKQNNNKKNKMKWK